MKTHPLVKILRAKGAQLRKELLGSNADRNPMKPPPDGGVSMYWGRGYPVDDRVPQHLDYKKESLDDKQ